MRTDMLKDYWQKELFICITVIECSLETVDQLKLDLLPCLPSVHADYPSDLRVLRQLRKCMVAKNLH